MVSLSDPYVVDDTDTGLEKAFLSIGVGNDVPRAVSPSEEKKESSPVSVVGGVSSPRGVPDREERRKDDLELADRLDTPSKTTSSSEHMEGVLVKAILSSGYADSASRLRLLLVSVAEASISVVYVVFFVEAASGMKKVSKPSPSCGMGVRFLATREPLGLGRWEKAIILTTGNGKATMTDSKVGGLGLG